MSPWTGTCWRRGLRRPTRARVPPYLELGEELSGVVWAAGALALHHVGLWTDDLAVTVQRLEAAGLPGRVRHSPASGDADLFSAA